MDTILQYLPRLFLLVVALVFLIFGVMGWLNPASTVAPLDLSIATAQAKTEIRATYGGLMVGIGLFILYTAIDTSVMRIGIIAVMVMLFVIGFTRLYGIVVDKPNAPLQWQLLSMELIPAIIALLFLVFYPFKVIAK